jgi:hypothetical protein
VNESSSSNGDGSARLPLVLGLDTFGDVTHDNEDRPLSHAQTIRNLVEQGVLADQVGARTTPCGCTSGTRPLMRSPTGGRR